VFAVLLGLFGLFNGGIILIGIAFFIYIGATSEAQQTVLAATFRDVQVRDVMTASTDLKTVARDDSVADLLDRMLKERHTGYPVVENGTLVGIVTLDDAREVSTVERDAYRVEDVMSEEVTTIPADSAAMDAFERLQQNDIGRMPVVDANGDLAGIISRTDLMTAFNIIQSSGRLEEEVTTDRQQPM